MDEDSDEALMQAFTRGDMAAFDRLYARHRGWLYRMIGRGLAGHPGVDDVYQETWLALIRSAPRYQPRARFTTWLYLLARQRLVDAWRVANPAGDDIAFNAYDDDDLPEALVAALSDPEADPARQVERSQLQAIVAAAIRELPPPQRETYLLAEEMQLTLEEIATITAVPRETAKSRLRYARARLLQALGGVLR